MNGDGDIGSSQRLKYTSLKSGGVGFRWFPIASSALAGSVVEYMTDRVVQE